jgi:hypothetical protein
MHGGVKLALYQANGLVTLLVILIPDRREDEHIGIAENPCNECERQTVLLPIDLILAAVELESHCLDYVFYI